MQISSVVALVTGANRGIGRSLVKALLDGGASKVYAGARDIASLATVVDFDPLRVVPLQLDVTDRALVAELATLAPDVQLLINNAGTLDFGSALDISIEAIERNFSVNFYGPLLTARALSPVIERNGGGAIVNIASVVSLASMPALAGYNASKAALWNLSQSLRGSLAGRNIAVHTVFPGPIDTDMAAEITFAKTSPADAAAAIVAGVAAGEEDIFPDPMAVQVYGGWKQDHKAVERQFAAM